MPESIKIDIWGQIEGESDNYRIKPPERVEIDAPAMGDGNTFERFFNETPCAFHKTHTVTSGGRAVIQKEVAYDDYANRESATYYPINQQPLTVYRQEIFYSGGTQTVSAVKDTAFTQVLNGGTMRYGTTPPSFGSSSYFYDAGTDTYQAIISSDGTISGKFLSVGTYNIIAFLVAPLAKPVQVPIVITVTNS